MTAVPRGVFYTFDERLEPVPGLQAEFEAWPRLSAYSASLMVRVFRMDRPLWRDSPGFPVANAAHYGFNRETADSAYSAHKLGVAFSPAIRMVWAESPRLTVFTRFGTFIAASRYDDQGLLAGPEAALGCEVRLTPYWGLRAEADWLAPINRDWTLSVQPAASVGVAYRLQPRPLPSYQPPVGMAFLIGEGPHGGLAPALLFDKRIGTAQDAGFEMDYSTSRFHSSVSYPATSFNPESSSETYGHIERLEFGFRYSLHTDPDRPAWIGLALGLGLATTAENDDSRRVQGAEITTETRGDNPNSLQFSFGPEAGMRLAGPLRLRARWRLMGATDASGFVLPAVAVGLEYRLSGYGKRR